MPTKKTRPLLALFLCLTLLFLPACGDRQGSEVPLNSLPSLAAEPPAPPAEPNNAVSNTVSYFPSELDPTQAPTLTWAVLQGVRLTEETAVELNRRLSELGCGYQVQFAVFGDFQKPAGKTMREALEEALGTSPDLITCGTRTYQRPSDPSRPLSEQPHAEELVYEDVKGELREENLLLPLDNYLQTEAGQELASQIVWDPDWLPARFEGRIYGIPTSSFEVYQRSVKVQTRVLEELGLSKEEFAQKIMDPDTLQALYELNGEKPFLSAISAGGFRPIGALSQPHCISGYPQYWMLTSSVALDLEKEENPVLLCLDTDAYQELRSFAELCYRQGYVTQSVEDIPPEEELLSFSIVSPRTRDYDANGISYTCIPLEQGYALPQDDMITAIYALSAMPEQAFDLLCRCNTSEPLQQLLAYGIEGLDYEVAEGERNPLREEYHIGSYLVYGEEFISVTPGVKVGGDPLPYEGMSLRESHLKDLQEAHWNPLFQLKADLSSVAQEAEQTFLTAREYNGQFLEKAAAGELAQWEQEFRQKLKSAGADRVVQELNRQAQAMLS